MVHAEQIGKHTRMNFARFKDVMEVPYLIEIQKTSYQWFLDKGLREVFNDINPIVDFSGNLYLEIVDYNLDGNPKYSVEECKERDTNYSSSFKVKIRYTNKQTGEIKEQNIFMADFPLMTSTGTFIINGAERVVVSQLVRSPGALLRLVATDKHWQRAVSPLPSSPTVGAWLEYELPDSNDMPLGAGGQNQKVAPNRAVCAPWVWAPMPTDNRASSERSPANLEATLQKDIAQLQSASLRHYTEIYQTAAPGRTTQPWKLRSPLINALFFDPRSGTTSCSRGALQAQQETMLWP